MLRGVHWRWSRGDGGRQGITWGCVLQNSVGRWFVSLGMLLLAGCLPTLDSGRPAVAPSSIPAPLALTIGWGVTPISAAPSSVLWLADDLGFYKQEGLAPELLLIQGTPNLVAGMRAGQVDVGLLTAYEAVLLTATRSLELHLIAGSGAAGQANTFIVIARDSIGSLDQLRGKSFAVARPGSYDDSLTKQFFNARGIDASEIQFLALGDPNVRVQALIAGRVDATLTSVSTWVSIRNEKSIKVLASFDEVNQAVPSWPAGAVVTSQVLRDKPEAIRRFTSALVKASRFFAQNKQAWVDAMASRRPDMRPDDLGELWDLFARGWAVNGGMNPNDYEKGADLRYRTSPDFAQVPRIGLAEWTDSQFVDAALREIGVDPKMDSPGRSP